MKKLVLIIVLLLTCITIQSIEKGKYNKIYDFFKYSSNQKLLEAADYYYDKGSTDSAIVCYTIICNRYDMQMSEKEKQIVAHAFNRSGVIYYMMCNYIRAQEMHLKSLNICEDINYKSYVPRINNNIGNIYASFGDNKRARKIYEKALKESLKYNDIKSTLFILDNLIGICCNMSDIPKTTYYLKLSNELDNGEGNKYVNFTARADIALKMGHSDLAIKYAKRAFHITDSLSMDSRFKCASLNDIARIFSILNKNDSALYYLLKSETIAKESNLLEMQHYIYDRITRIGKLMQDQKLYLHYNDLYKNLNDSIMNMKVYGRVKDIEFIFEMDQIDKQMAGMKKEQEKKDNQLSRLRSVIIVVSSVLLTIALFFVITYNQKKRLQYSYKNIFNKNIEIVEAEKQAKQQHLKYQHELRDKEKYITELESLARQLNLKDENLSNSVKYQNSSLNEELRSSLIQTINEVMENTTEFCNAEFNLERLAFLVNSRTKYVSQAINETYGKNFNRYVNEYRIKEARNRLTNTSEYGHITVKGIAQSVGFKSNTNFNLLFKEITGLTPSIYQSMSISSNKEEKSKRHPLS